MGGNIHGQATPVRSKAKQAQGAARPIRAPGRLHEVGGDTHPREMIAQVKQQGGSLR